MKTAVKRTHVLARIGRPVQPLETGKAVLALRARGGETRQRAQEGFKLYLRPHALREPSRGLRRQERTGDTRTSPLRGSALSAEATVSGVQRKRRRGDETPHLIVLPSRTSFPHRNSTVVMVEDFSLARFLKSRRGIASSVREVANNATSGSRERSHEEESGARQRAGQTRESQFPQRSCL